MLKIKLTGCLPVFFLLLFSSAVGIFAQSSTATLSGTVTDERDAVVAGATVKVSNTDTGFERTVTTDENGSFSVPFLPPSAYLVTINRTGFAPFEARDVVLNVNDQRALNVKLKVGAVGETVTVNADANTIQETPEVATVVDRQFVANLPLNGRSFQSLIALSPGVVTISSAFLSAGQFSVNGQRGNSNYFSVDGVSANVGVSQGYSPSQEASGSLPALSVTGGTSNLVSVDALQEFKIQTSTYAPEFGRTPGAQISIVTRSGTNDFRGSVFDYLRNDVLDANDWFANANNLERAPLRQNDFGFVIGGPVFLPRFGEGTPPFYNGRDRTFFFLSYEGLRLLQPRTGVISVASLAARQRAVPAIQPLLNSFPIPNGPDLGNDLAQFSASYSDPSNQDSTSIRIDHTVNKKLSLFGRYNAAPSSSNIRNGSLNGSTYTYLNTRTLTGGATLILSSRLNNDLRLNWSEVEALGTGELDGFGGGVPPPDSALFPPFASSNDAIVIFLFGGTTVLKGRNIDNFQKQFNIVDTVSFTADTHQLKFGVDYRRLAPVFGPRAYDNVVFFNSITQATTGIASLVLVNANYNRLNFRFQNFSAFGQDTWRVTRRLTLTYGARWELNPPPSEEQDRLPFTLIGLDAPRTATLAPAGTPLYKTTFNNFAPRIGVAYQLSQHQGWETVLRGGFGVFYDLAAGQTLRGAETFPYVSSKTLIGVSFPLSATNAAPLPFTTNPPIPTLTIPDPNLKLPYTLQWNFAVEQSLGPKQTVSATYVAAAGRRLLRQENLAGNILTGNPIFTASSQLRVTRNLDTSDYNALQLQYQRHLAGGLQALASYTWSHSIDTSSNESSVNPSSERLDPRLNRGSSDFDIRHTFNAGITYNLPTPKIRKVGRALLGGWSIDSTVLARSAPPLNITYVRNFGFGSFGFRPDLIPGIPLYLDDPNAPGGRRINNTLNPSNPRQVGPFVAPTEARQGTLGRNSLRGFPAYQVDLAVRRRFKFTERVGLQLRAEFFNILNHPNFASPGTALGTFATSTAFPTGRLTGTSPFFGQSTQMLGRSLGGLSALYQIGGPRSGQLALKLEF